MIAHHTFLPHSGTATKDSRENSWARLLLLTLGLLVVTSPAMGQERPAVAAEEATFQEQIQPLVKKYCLRCHNADEMKSGIRVDQLSAAPGDRQLFLLKDIAKQVADGTMPPEDEPQPTVEERKKLADWISQTMTAARTRVTARNGTVRRLTVAQYKNTLRDLLGLEENLIESLPPDGVSKDGFVNNVQTLGLTPLQVEAYFNIAEKALDLCLVDERAKPVIQNFRMDLGTKINPSPCPDNLVLGANNFLLANPDVLVTELQPRKPFPYEPFAMRTKYEFIEGYVGNDTIRAWKKFDSIYHSVFACMRGTPGYPKGEAHQVVPSGLLLRPAIPSPEIFGVSNTYGPMANFKISLRELPEQGNFRVTVQAARYDDGLLLDGGTRVQDAAAASATAEFAKSPEATIAIKEAGIYQVDVYCAPGKPQGLCSLSLGERQFAGQLFEQKPGPADPDKDLAALNSPAAFLLVRLPAGELKVAARYGDNARLRRIVFSQLPEDSDPAKRFAVFEKCTPTLGVYLGLRRDCGSTLTQVGLRRVAGFTSEGKLRDYVFEGAISNFPTPDVERDNVNYLAGIREIGVRSEYTDGRDMPRLLVRSVEFEGPYYASWPPATHRNIFLESAQAKDSAAYAAEIIRSFATRAFRRPVTEAELQTFVGVWKNSFAEKGDFRQSIKDALLVVLTSPQFLFLIETSQGPQAEDLDSYELASKLSYFLWNTAPDARLLELAAKNKLRESLDGEIDRMIRDQRFGQFAREFASQWLSLDKFDVVAVDAQRYPRLTRDVKTQLREEPERFLRSLMERNLPLRNLVQSDFIMANEVVAAYYNLGQRTENGFEFIPIIHDSATLGGVLSQASILSGLSDGREANPVKRGAWLARKIIARPPDDPPPNVPQLKDDEGAKLTLREKLERHRSVKTCAKCHAGIDPWGLPFEAFDAGGLFKKEAAANSQSKLPDGTEVKDLNGLKAHLANDQLDRVAFSFLKHLATYASGRSLTYNELAFLEEEGVKLKANEYRMQELIRFVVKSDIFLKK